MKKKSTMLIFSFALSTLLVVSTVGFSSSSEANEDRGMMNTMNENGMVHIMGAINSSEGQEMIEGCNNFMSAYEEDK